MIIKILKISSILLISALFCFVAFKTIQACSYWEEPDNRDYSVFTPEIIHQPGKTPFFLSYRHYYGYESYGIPETVPTVTQRNTVEWVAMFNNRVKTEDMEWLLYGSVVRQLELIRRNFAGEKVNIDTLNKSFLSQLKPEKNISAILDYIIWAKKSEKYFNPDYNSWDPLVYDTVAIGELIPVFRKNFLQAGHSFLKNRYGFQLTRALCARGDYKECIDFIDKQFKPTKEAGSMYYRSLGYKARAWYRLGNYSQANYLYAYLYDHDPCATYSAFQSFHPQEEADWNATLQLATTTREKEILWQLLGIYANPLRGMKEIYALNPKSDLLPLLLVRAVNLAEEYALMNPVRSGDFYYVNYKSSSGSDESSVEGYGFSTEGITHDSSTNTALLNFIKRTTQENKIQKPAVWQLSSAYLLLLDGDLKASEKIVSALRIDRKDSLLSGQVEIIKGLLAIKKMTAINANQEKILYGHIQKINGSGGKELRKDNAIRYILSQLSLYYDKRKDTLKKELCYPQANYFYRSSRAIQQMIDFMSRKNLSEMEKFMIGRYPLQLRDLYEEKAVALLYEYRFKEAVAEFDKIPGTGSELYGNPFTIRIMDCHDCDHRAVQKIKYTKYSFAKKMIELKDKGDTSVNAEERAQNYFLYANGLYNMTWYGNGRFIHETRISIVDYYTGYDEESESHGKINYYTCNEAMVWYQKALALSKNKEFRAKCTWMSAKCEHNIWLDSGPDKDVTGHEDFVAGKYFTKMKTEYADTRYYQEVINECGYFCTFITHSGKCIRDSSSLLR